MPARTANQEYVCCQPVPSSYTSNRSLGNPFVPTLLSTIAESGLPRRNAVNDSCVCDRRGSLRAYGFSLRQLETFVWVAALGNFRKAAQQLNTTQPTISTRIAGLENQLRVKLFERDTGSVRLTSKGQELLPYAEKVLRMADLLRERTENDSALSGVLRLGVSETIVHTLLPTFLSELHDLYPNIDVEITVDVTINLRNELVSRNLDLAFLMGPISEYRIDNIDLASFPLVWAASPLLGIDVTRPLTMDELVKYPILTYVRITRPHVEIESYLRNHCELPARIFPSSSLAACLQ